jgi:hypothetical protein
MANPVREPLADKYIHGIITTIDVVRLQDAISEAQHCIGSDCVTVWLRDKRTHDTRRILYDITDVDAHDDTHPQTIRRMAEYEHLSVTPEEWNEYELVMSFGRDPFLHMIFTRLSDETVVVVSMWRGDLQRPPRNAGHITNG